MCCVSLRTLTWADIKHYKSIITEISYTWCNAHTIRNYKINFYSIREYVRERIILFTIKCMHFCIWRLFWLVRLDKVNAIPNFNDIPYRLDIYEPLNRTSSRIVRVTAASGLALECRIVLPWIHQKSKLRIVRARSIRV